MGKHVFLFIFIWHALQSAFYLQPDKELFPFLHAMTEWTGIGFSHEFFTAGASQRLVIDIQASNGEKTEVLDVNFLLDPMLKNYLFQVLTAPRQFSDSQIRNLKRMDQFFEIYLSRNPQWHSIEYRLSILKLPALRDWQRNMPEESQLIFRKKWEVK